LVDKGLESVHGHSVEAALDFLVTRSPVADPAGSQLHHDSLGQQDVDPGDRRQKPHVAAVGRKPRWAERDQQLAARRQCVSHLGKHAGGVGEVLHAVLGDDDIEAVLRDAVQGLAELDPAVQPKSAGELPCPAEGLGIGLKADDPLRAELGNRARLQPRPAAEVEHASAGDHLVEAIEDPSKKGQCAVQISLCCLHRFHKPMIAGKRAG